jgi:outer membrane murein-binding lipoprotein Lpp
MTMESNFPPPRAEKPKVELGCTSLVIIAIIVLIFSETNNTRGLKKRIDQLNAKIDRLETKIDQLQKPANAAPKPAPMPAPTPAPKS